MIYSNCVYTSNWKIYSLKRREHFSSNLNADVFISISTQQNFYIDNKL